MSPADLDARAAFAASLAREAIETSAAMVIECQGSNGWATGITSRPIGDAYREEALIDRNARADSSRPLP